ATRLRATGGAADARASPGNRPMGCHRGPPIDGAAVRGPDLRPPVHEEGDGFRWRPRGTRSPRGALGRPARRPGDRGLLRGDLGAGAVGPVIDLAVAVQVLSDAIHVAVRPLLPELDPAIAVGVVLLPDQRPALVEEPQVDLA